MGSRLLFQGAQFTTRQIFTLQQNWKDTKVKVNEIRVGPTSIKQLAEVKSCGPPIGRMIVTRWISSTPAPPTILSLLFVPFTLYISSLL